jgi:hypothetical protein
MKDVRSSRLQEDVTMKIPTVIGAVSMMLLGGCGEPSTTAEGCPIYYGEIMRAQTEACVAAYHEERARAAGGVVTQCRRVGNDLSCVTQ